MEKVRANAHRAADLLGRRPITTRQLRRADQVDLACYGLRRALRSRPIMHEQVFREPDYSVRGVGSGPARRRPDSHQTWSPGSPSSWHVPSGRSVAQPMRARPTRACHGDADNGVPDPLRAVPACGHGEWVSVVLGLRDRGQRAAVAVERLRDAGAGGHRSQTRRAVPTGAGHGGQPVADTSDQHLRARDIAAGASSYKRFADLASLSEFQTCRAMSS